jgi:hypothetical protein
MAVRPWQRLHRQETRDFACALGLQPCFTPVARPESNGRAEALVRTFERGYVRGNPLPQAVTVLRQLHRSFADYNDNHLRRGLGMRSPREFIRTPLIQRHVSGLMGATPLARMEHHTDPSGTATLRERPAQSGHARMTGLGQRTNPLARECAARAMVRGRAAAALTG